MVSSLCLVHIFHCMQSPLLFRRNQLFNHQDGILLVQEDCQALQAKIDNEYWRIYPWVSGRGKQTSPTRRTELSSNHDATTFLSLQHAPVSSGKPQKSEQSTDHETAEDTMTTEERKAANRYRWKIIIGLILPFTVQALDVTIIASAIPFIASDFSKFSITLNTKF